MLARGVPVETHTEAEVQRRIMRAIVTLRCVRDADAAMLRGGSRGWPRQLIDAAEALREAVRKGKADRKRLGLKARDFDDFHFSGSEDDDGRQRWVPPFEPTRHDFDTYLEALGWWAALARLASKPAPSLTGDGHLPRDTDQRIIWWVASGFSFEAIGRREDCDGKSAERRYRRAMLDCWRIANGWARLQGP